MTSSNRSLIRRDFDAFSNDRVIVCGRTCSEATSGGDCRLVAHSRPACAPVAIAVCFSHCVRYGPRAHVCGAACVQEASGSLQIQPVLANARRVRKSPPVLARFELAERLGLSSNECGAAFHVWRGRRSAELSARLVCARDACIGAQRALHMGSTEVLSVRRSPVGAQVAHVSATRRPSRRPEPIAASIVCRARRLCCV